MGSSGAGISCGNGMVEGDEECDDGRVTAECDLDCTFPACGDGQHNAVAGETCDEGGDSPTCDADCTAVACGDGHVNEAAGETCEAEGVETATCDADCTAVECGDGEVNRTAGETCDDGNREGGDGCDANCGQSCVRVGGLDWCYAEEICGQGCNAVCGALGRTPHADLAGWLAAQDTQAECEAIAEAFGIPAATVGSYSYACLEVGGDHREQLFGGNLLCSSFSGCPQDHLEGSDSLGVGCDQEVSFRPICPCD